MMGTAWVIEKTAAQGKLLLDKQENISYNKSIDSKTSILNIGVIMYGVSAFVAFFVAAGTIDIGNYWLGGAAGVAGAISAFFAYREMVAMGFFCSPEVTENLSQENEL